MQINPAMPTEANGKENSQPRGKLVFLHGSPPCFTHIQSHSVRDPIRRETAHRPRRLNQPPVAEQRVHLLPVVLVEQATPAKPASCWRTLCVPHLVPVVLRRIAKYSYSSTAKRVHP